MRRAAVLSRYSGEFDDPAAESAFRAAHFAETMRHARLGMLVAAIVNLLFLISDARHYGTPLFADVVVLRGAVIAVSLAAHALVARVGGAAAQTLVVGWVVALTVLVAALFSVAPSNVALFVTYFLPTIYILGLPIGFSQRVLLAVGAGALFLGILLPARLAAGDNAFGLALVMALVVLASAVPARQSNRLLRINHLALGDERRERDILHRQIEMLPVPLMLTRASDDVLVQANQRARDLLGLSSPDVAGLSLEELCLDGQTLTTLRDRLRQDNCVAAMPAELRLPGGRSCAVLISAATADVDGEACILTTAINIEDRQRAERALRDSEERNTAILDALSASGIGLVIVDRDYRVRHLNQTLAALHGEVAGQLCYRGMADSDEPCAHCRLPIVIDDGLLVRQELTAADRVLDVVAVPFVDHDGARCKLEIIHDVTERRRAEEALKRAHDELELRVADRTRSLRREVAQREQAEWRLRRAKEEAELADRAKSAFLANMSHELRTPLNAIIGFSDVIRQQVFGPIGSAKYDEYVGNIHESGQHLLELINDVLDISAIEADKVELSETEIDIVHLAEASLRLVRPRAESGRIRLIDAVPQDMPRLYADARRIKQILLNLLSNAVKFTPANGTVTLEAARTASGGLVLRVRDTGVGMTPAGIAIALTTFGQVDSGLDRKQEGTGLGLPLTRALVKLHGGTLAVDSTPGVGTVVAVQFGPERVIAAGGSEPAGSGVDLVPGHVPT